MNVKPIVYLETSFISYVCRRLSNDFLISAHQRVSRDWWENKRESFDICISQLVLDEVTAGNRDESLKRIELIKGIREILITPESISLAKNFIESGALPKKAADDALHMAVAAVSGADYLLTWNCKHIANAQIVRIITSICLASGYKSPVICTPLELNGGENE